MQITIENEPLSGVELKERRQSYKDDPLSKHWRITLRLEGREFVISYSQGSGIKVDPTPKSVLECALSDAGCVESVETFEEFCDNLGFDSDSRKAEASFRECLRVRDDLREFLGEAEYEKAMSLGSEEYCRILFDGEDILPRHQNERVLPWREFDHDGVRHRVCLHFGVDIDWGRKYTQDPSISAQTHVQRWNDEVGVWTEGWVDDAASHLHPEEQALEKLHLCGVLTGPLHHVANSLYWYQMMIGAKEPSKEDVQRWRREFPDAANPTGMGAERSFKRSCAYGVVDPEPPFPAVVEEGAAAPLPANELVENMQVWLEQRLPCLTHAIHAKIAEVGLPLDEIVAAAKEIERRRALRGPPRQAPPRPKLIHTITAEDVKPRGNLPSGEPVKWRPKSIELPACKHCGTGVRKIQLDKRLKEGDVGKRVYQIFREDGRPSSIQVESDNQLKSRLERRNGGR